MCSGPRKAALNERFGPLANKERWLVNDDCALHIHPNALAEKKADLKRGGAGGARRAAETALCGAAYTRTDLLRGEAPGQWGRHMLASFHPERSADVLFQLQPYFLLSSRPHGTTHGTPYNYDTHVPLLWFGVVTPGVRTERVGVDDLAPTLSGSSVWSRRRWRRDACCFEAGAGGGAGPGGPVAGVWRAGSSVMGVE